MPTYEYACRECGAHLEVVQSFRDDALTTCPTCSGPLRKVFAAAGIIFKGSGYYVNDSRKAAPSTAAKKDGSDSKGKDGAAAASSSSKGGDSSSKGGDSSSKGGDSAPKRSGESSSSGSGSSDAAASA